MNSVNEMEKSEKKINCKTCKNCSIATSTAIISLIGKIAVFQTSTIISRLYYSSSQLKTQIIFYLYLRNKSELDLFDARNIFEINQNFISLQNERKGATEWLFYP